MDEAKWVKVNRKAIAVIRQCVENSVFHLIANETSAKKIWEKLEGVYASSSATSKAFLIRKLLHFKMNEEKSIAEHLNNFQELTNNLEKLEINFGDEVKALMLMGSLPDSWETLIVSLSNSNVDGTVSLSKVSSSLLNEEMRRKSFEDKSIKEESGSALVAHKERDNYHRGGRGGKFRDDNRRKPEYPRRNFQGVVCHFCKETWHIQTYCDEFRKVIEGQNAKYKKDEANIVTSDNESDEVLAVEREDEAKDRWFLDSAASFHICKEKESFVELKDIDDTVKVGDGRSIKVKGVGRVRIRNDKGKVISLTEVRYIPDIEKNLISLGELDRKGCSTTISKGALRVERGGRYMLGGVKDFKNFYRVDGVVEGVIKKVEKENFSNIGGEAFSCEARSNVEIPLRKEKKLVERVRTKTVWKPFLYYKRF